MPITRRTFLTQSLNLLTAFSVGWPFTLRAQLPAAIPFIDPHTHIFNAKDIPIAGFAKKVIPQMLEELGWAGHAIAILAAMLAKAAQRVAPGYQAEAQKLDGWLEEGRFMTLADWSVRDPQATNYYQELIREYENLDRGQQTILEEEFRRTASVELEELRTAIEEGDQEATLLGFDLMRIQTDFLELEKPFLKFLEASRDEESVKAGQATQFGDESRARSEIFGWIPGARFVRQIKHFAQYRYNNASDLINVYPQVDAFASASLDFDYWLGSDLAETTTWEQIDLLSKISRLTNGKILGIAGCNPWANHEDPQRLAAIEEGIATKGLIGVKLYPPMGFQPWENKAHDNDPDWWPDNAPPNGFGTTLDGQLQKIYKLCLERKVVIMAHANDSNGAGPDFAKRADPALWDEVLKNLNDLRFNMGHSGGYEKVTNDDRWFLDALRVARTFSHTYMDFSHFGEIYSSKKRKKLAKAFRRHQADSAKFMYASDWYMLVSQKNYEEYLSNFMQMIGDAGLSNDIMGLNAARYLGLSSGHVTRQRLDQFFAGSNPDWYSKIP